MFIEDINQNIKNIAYLALFKSNKIQIFTELEYDLRISKEEIIKILDLFKKAELFSYAILPISGNDTDDYGSRRKRYELATGSFKLFLTDEVRKNKNRKDIVIKKIESLYNSEKQRNLFIKKYVKYFKLQLQNDKEMFNVGKLNFNFITGDFSYHNAAGNFKPKTQEYRVLYVLLKNPNFQVSYEELLGIISPTVNPKAKSERDRLYTVIKKLKNRFGILNKSNPDFIINIKNFGYRLVF